MKVFFDIGAKCKKGIKNLDLSVDSLLSQLAIENFKDRWQNRRKEWFELCVKRLAQRLDERNYGQLQGHMFP